MSDILSESKKKIILGALKSAQIQKDRAIERREIYRKNPNYCAVCKNSLPYNKRCNKYCSRSCSASSNNKGVVRNGTKRKIKFCANCGKLLGLYACKYCSRKCQREYEWECRKKIIEDDGKSPNERQAKKYLLETREHRCSVCGLEEWMNQPIPLIMDHINGNPTDHRIINLRLVCGNCDMQLPTSRGKNKGNGRKYRREFYKKHGYC